MKKKAHKVYRYFIVSGKQNLPERFWSFGFSDSPYLPPGSNCYVIHLSRGVTKVEASKRLKGCPTIREVIGDIRISELEKLFIYS